MKTQKNKTKLTMFRPQIRSRHPSHNPLRTQLPKLGFKSVIRLGSTTELPDTIPNGGTRVEINTTQSIKNSSNKELMKTCFSNHSVKTARWSKTSSISIINNDGISLIDGETTLKFPIVIKHHYGSRNSGNVLLRTLEDFQSWVTGKSLNNYIIEEYHNYNREYRVHVTKDGCFYACRKMLKSDTPEEQRWFRNDSNSVWILEENEKFDKPVNWEQIVEQCVKALISVGLDIGAVDLKVQSSSKDNGSQRENPDFIVIEINSAPSFGEITLVKYKEELVKLLNYKKNG